jgi:hypothetical protein
MDQIQVFLRRLYATPESHLEAVQDANQSGVFYGVDGAVGFASFYGVASTSKSSCQFGQTPVNPGR